MLKNKSKFVFLINVKGDIYAFRSGNGYENMLEMQCLLDVDMGG